jgi:sugar fermentation stimulation protein A
MSDWVRGIFKKRINRFIAEVVVKDKIEQVHVANTGRLKELLVEDAEILLSDDEKPERKTKYTLRIVRYSNRWVSIDSQLPNRLIYEWLTDGTITNGNKACHYKREVKNGDSRFDLYCKELDQFIEVKGVTLVVEGVAMFPDAPTTRGVKHVNHLKNHVLQGGRGAIYFLIQRNDAIRFSPFYENDPEFGQALKDAHASGVEIRAFIMKITESAFVFEGEIPIAL